MEREGREMMAKWHVYANGRYIGSVKCFIEDLIDSLDGKPFHVWEIGHAIDIGRGK